MKERGYDNNRSFSSEQEVGEYGANTNKMSTLIILKISQLSVGIKYQIIFQPNSSI